MNCKEQNKTTRAHPKKKKKKKRNQQKRKATIHGKIIMHAVKRREKMGIVVKVVKILLVFHMKGLLVSR